MLSRLLKPPSKDTKRKGCKDDLKEASYHEQLSRVRSEDLASPRTPRTPRLERARNLRWHLVELDKFEDIPRRSLSSYSIASSETPRHETLSPTLSEPICASVVDKKGDTGCVQQNLPSLESSPDSSSLSHAHRSSQFRQLRESDDGDDGDEISSEYSAASSAGSPPKSADAAGAGWEGSRLDTDAASSFTRRARKKVNTPKRLQDNGLDKIRTAQERIEVVGPVSTLPIPAYPISPLKKEPTSLLVGPRPSNVAGSMACGSKGVQHNLSGPLCVQQKKDLPPHEGPQNPLVSPHTSDLARSVLNGSKGVHNNFSGPLRVQKKRDQSPHFKSPLQSPLSSPQTTSGGTVSPHCDYHTGLHDDVQTAHPLPLPWASNTPSVSPRSNTSSAERSEESCRVDSALMPTGRGDAGPTGGKWLKGSLLGSGSFGKVYRGHHSETGDMCAIKEVEIVADDPRSKECAKQLAQEIALLSMLRHPNILHYKGSEMVGESLYIYLELVSGGSIYRLLQEFNNSFTEPVIRRYTRQILRGLEFLHGKSTVHRDIKCANILVDQDGRVKLADFGMAKLIGNETSPLSFKGSPYWMAPEVLLQNNTGFECALDIWSLGCTVIEMATGKPPWFQYEGYAAMFKVMNCHEVPIPNSLSRTGRNFVSLCLQRDPGKRPTATELLQHPFVQVDREPSLLVQTVSNSLCQDMIRKGMPKDSRYHFHTTPQAASRPTGPFSSAARSPRPPHQAHIPTSRSAIQLSDYPRSKPAREVRRLGQLTDTEDYTNHFEDSPSNHGGLLNKRYNDIHGLPLGMDSNTQRSFTPRN